MKKFIKRFFMCLLIIPLMFTFSACKKKPDDPNNNQNKPDNPGPGPVDPGGEDPGTSSRYTINVKYNLPTMYSSLLKNFSDSGEKSTGYALPSFKGTNLDSYFEGWFYEKNNIEIPNGVISGISEQSISVYAKWKENEMLESYYTDGLKFDLKDNIAYVSGYLGDMGDVVIPSVYKNNDIVYKVIGIKDNAFENNKKVTNILMSPSIDEFTIGKNAFSSSSLKDIDLTNVTSIFDYAFSESKIESIKIGNNISSLSNYLFSKCSNLKKVELSNSVQIIGAYTFQDCTALSDLSFLETDNLTTIDDYAFSGCMTLNNLTLPKNISNLGLKVFENCLNLRKITIYDNFCYRVNDGENFSDRFGNLESSLREICFGDGVETIPEYYFDGYFRLERIDISDTVETIEGYAFYNCTNLQAVNISESSHIMNFDASSLANTKWMSTNDTMIVKNNVLLIAPDGIGEEIVLTENIERIASYAFAYNTTLKKLTIPESLKKIDSYAFYNNGTLEEVVFSGEDSLLSEISSYAFYGCNNLNNIDLSKALRLMRVGDYAFYGLSSNKNAIDKFIIPSSIEHLGRAVFSNSNIVKFETTDGNSNYIFADEQGVLYLLNNGKISSLYAYPSASSLKKYSVNSEVSVIEFSAFDSALQLEHLYLTSENIEIKKGAFSNTDFIVLSEKQNLNLYSNCFTTIYYLAVAELDIDYIIVENEDISIELVDGYSKTLYETGNYNWYLKVNHNSNDYTFLIELTGNGESYNVTLLI